MEGVSCNHSSQVEILPWASLSWSLLWYMTLTKFHQINDFYFQHLGSCMWRVSALPLASICILWFLWGSPHHASCKFYSKIILLYFTWNVISQRLEWELWSWSLWKLLSKLGQWEWVWDALCKVGFLSGDSLGNVRGVVEISEEPFW